MVRKISKELEKEIVNRYYLNTASELGEEYHINPNTIKGIWNRNGCSGKRNFTPDKEEFIKLYNSHSIMEIANYYQIDRHTVVRYAKKIGIYKPKQRLLTKEQEQEIIDQYNYTTSTELAKRYNVSTSKINQVWSQAGLKGKTSRIYYLDENFFENIDTDEKAYWVGFIASDGCLYHPKDNRQDILSISLSIKDKEHLEKFKTSLKTNKPLSVGKHGSHKQFEHICLQISSNKLCQDLQKIGITYRKTYDVQWPKIPQQLLPAYIRGYFDGDGHISHKIEENHLHNVSITIAGFYNNLKNFQDYLETQGIQSSFSLHNDKNRAPNFGCLWLSNKFYKQKFLHLIYDNASVYLDRKYLLANRFIDLYNKHPTSWEVQK